MPPIGEFANRRRLITGHSGPLQHMQIPKTALAFLDVRLKEIHRLAELLIFTAAFIELLSRYCIRVLDAQPYAVPAMKLLKQFGTARKKSRFHHRRLDCRIGLTPTRHSRGSSARYVRPEIRNPTMDARRHATSDSTAARPPARKRNMRSMSEWGASSRRPYPPKATRQHCEDRLLLPPPPPCRTAFRYRPMIRPSTSSVMRCHGLCAGGARPSPAGR